MLGVLCVVFKATDPTSVRDGAASVGVFVLHPLVYFGVVFVLASSKRLKAKLHRFKSGCICLFFGAFFCKVVWCVFGCLFVLGVCLALTACNV